VIPVSIASLHQAKWAFTTRHVRRKDIERLLPASAASEAGQLLLAEVTQLGQHDGVQLESGRRSQLYLGDRIVVCLGSRYAPDQFEGIAKIENGQDCELLAGGGVAGVVRHRHGRMRAATGLRVLGVLGDADGLPVNIARYALALPDPKPSDRPAIPVMVVVGSSMNAGKTTACASLIHGLARDGWQVGAVKITGTGSFGDVQSYADAGAAEVLDFTDAGLASTYRVEPALLERTSRRLIAELEARGCDVVVVEIADGLLQQETAALVASPTLRDALVQVVFAAADAMGAVAGVQRLRGLGWKVSAFTGLVTASPLAASEAEAALRSAGSAVPCFSRDELRNPLGASRLLGLRQRALPLAA
jgi:molybdopterin-guanine dinucleotide biosynthesis protein